MEKGVEDVGFEVSLSLEFALGASGGREGWVSCSLGLGRWGIGTGGKGIAHRVQGLGLIVRDEIRRRFLSG